MAQTYTPVGAVALPQHAVSDEGGTLTLTNIGQTELDYKSSINRDVDLFGELTNLISNLCRATTTGLSSGTAALPYASQTPREVLFRLRHMIDAMLTQSIQSY